jgi:hypothetical protein
MAVGQLEVAASYDAAIGREWRRIAEPSSFLTGVERVGLAMEARRARWGDGTPTGVVSEPAAEAARRLSADPARAIEGWALDGAYRPACGWFDRLVARGLDPLAYVEIIGLVSRLVAVDTFEFGVGRALRPLPDPVAGAPTGQVDPEAAMNGAWVPTVGDPQAPVALSAIPAEHEALHDIHGVFYIPADQILDFDLVLDLIRPQLELVAARTSMLNECFY